MRSFILAGGLALALAGTIVLAQQAQPTTTTQATPTFAAGGTAVVVDVVVRDKGGKPVTDLKAADFELLEDDVPQTIGDVALVAPTPPAGAPGAAVPMTPAGAPSVATNSVSAPTFVALVFDRLSPEGRALAHKGAMTYLDTTRDNDFAGVYVVSNSLEMIQTYTTDRTRLKKALDEAATRATANFSKNADRPFKAFGDTNPATSMTASAEERGPATGATLTNPGGGVSALPGQPSQGNSTNVAAGFDAVLQRVVNRTEATYESMMRDQQGYATTDGLMAIIDALSVLPGRKTVVFFAEGLAIPPAVQARFDSVVATANRSNVSVYTVDSAGLRVHSSQTETAANINALGTNALDRDPDAPGAQADDRVDGVQRGQPAQGPERQPPDARRAHGRLPHQQHEQPVEGLPGDRQRSPLPLPAHLQPEEHRLQGRMAEDHGEGAEAGGRRPLAHRLHGGARPGRAAAARLRGVGNRRARADAAPERSSGAGRRLQLPRREEARAARAARRRRRQHDPGEHGGRHLPDRLHHPRAHQERAGRGGPQGEPAVQADGPGRPGGHREAGRHPVLPRAGPAARPVHRRLRRQRQPREEGRRRVGARSWCRTRKPDSSSSAACSWCAAPRSSRPVEQKDNPLHVGDLLLYPNIGEPLKKSVDKGLSFYIAITPAAGQPAPVAVLELSAGTQTIGQVPMQLAAPGPDGRIRNSAQLPLANFPPGDYGLKVIVTQGTAKEVREAKVKVID